MWRDSDRRDRIWRAQGQAAEVCTRVRGTSRLGCGGEAVAGSFVRFIDFDLCASRTKLHSVIRVRFGLPRRAPRPRLALVLGPDSTAESSPIGAIIGASPSGRRPARVSRARYSLSGASRVVVTRRSDASLATRLCHDLRITSKRPNEATCTLYLIP